MWYFLLLLLLLPFAVVFGRRRYIKAIKLEKEGKYKEACYEYAVILLNGAVINERKIRNRIKYLWEEYGPFDYGEDLKRELAKPGVDKNCEEAGHAAVMSLIKESIK